MRTFAEDTKLQWKIYSTDFEEPPTYEQVKAFLKKRQTMEADSGDKDACNSKPKNSSHLTKSAKAFAVTSRDNRLKCSVCREEGQKLYQCSTFKALNVSSRKQLVRVNWLCFNCLSYGHNSGNY